MWCKFVLHWSQSLKWVCFRYNLPSFDHITQSSDVLASTLMVMQWVDGEKNYCIACDRESTEMHSEKIDKKKVLFWLIKNWKFCWNNTVRRRKSTSNLVGFTEHCRVLSDLLTTLKGENESIDSLIDLIYFIYFLELCNQHQLLNSPQSKAHESRFPPAVESRSQDTLPWFGLDWLLCLAK